MPQPNNLVGGGSGTLLVHLKMLLPYGVLLILNREKRDRQCYSSGEEVRAMRDISSTPGSGSLPMMNHDHGSMGSKGIITLTSH
jgi:hypothetical protein